MSFVSPRWTALGYGGLRDRRSGLSQMVACTTTLRGPHRRPMGRWSVLVALMGFAFFAYVERTSIAVAAERMMPELGITQVELGWLLTAFLASYTALQIPGGWIGERFGARRTLGGASVLALAATALTIVAPTILPGVAVIGMSLVARALLGVAQAPVFPVSSGAIEAWFPHTEWGLAQGLLNSGLNLGAAATPPMIAYLMAASGWRVALLVTSAPLVLLTVYWFWRATDTPSGETTRPISSAPAMRQVRRLLADRDLLALSVSYLSMNYVFYLLTFWCFLYFVQERHFSTIDSGWLAAAPFIAAGVGAAVGGKACDAWRRRLGDRWGFRAVPLIALPISACALYAALRAEGPLAADIALCVAFASIEISEGAYWAGAMRIAGRDSMISTGLLNTAGNLGGIIGTPIVATLSVRHGWTQILVTGSVCAMVAALLWLRVDASRRTLPVANADASSAINGIQII